MKLTATMKAELTSMLTETPDRPFAQARNHTRQALADRGLITFETVRMAATVTCKSVFTDAGYGLALELTNDQWLPIAGW